MQCVAGGVHTIHREPLPTRFTPFPLTVSRLPVRLYILGIAYEQAIPLACTPALYLVKVFSDYPLVI